MRALRSRAPLLLLLPLVGCGVAVTEGRPITIGPEMREELAQMPVPRPEVSVPSDAAIADAVERRIRRAPELRGLAIDAEAENGIVTISGTVDHLLARRLVYAITSSTRGVRAVVDHTIVAPEARTDHQIRNDLERALAAHTATNELRLDVEVEDARVRLRGRVSSATEASAVESIAASIRGVRAIDAGLEVSARAAPEGAELRDDIAARLARDVRIDASLLRIGVDGRRAVLSGSVATVTEREHARHVALAAGAREVDASRLEVARWARDPMRRTRPLEPDPERVEAAIRDAIEVDDRVGDHELFVDVDAGIATLQGRVDNAAAERAAVEDAMNTLGVWQVVERIAVVPERTVGDDELERAVEQALAATPWIDRSPLDAEVRHGIVTLRGTVSGPHARALAERVVAGIDGVVDVHDRIAIAGIGEPVADWMLEEAVRDGLEWNPAVDASLITVGVEDGVVTLTGHLVDVHAVRAAIREAQDAGARAVVDALTVNRP